MSGPVHITSDGEWDSLLSGTSVVVADFYADWCGPCKMIAPHFERLAKEHSSPNKVAFAKVNVDNQANIARTNGITAMPTFKIFHNGTAIETIRGANPSALTEAVNKAVSLSGSSGKKAEAAFKTPGRTLGGDGPVQGQGRPWNVSWLFNLAVMLLGLYLTSLFSIDAFKAAEQSMFNPNRQPAPQLKPTAAAKGPAPAGSARAQQQQQKPAFRTLADL